MLFLTTAMPDSPALRISEFDALGRAITFERGVQDQSASPISVTYNAASQFTSVTQTGRTLSLQYDEEGRLSEVINRVGRKMQLQYDEAGQLISIESVGGHRYTQEYDEEGRVIGESLMDQLLRAKLPSHNFPNYRSYNSLVKTLNSQPGVITSKG